jgi:hypothetical protein
MDCGVFHFLHYAASGVGDMSAVRDQAGAAPDLRRPRFLWLVFACAAAPSFWLGQMMLGYGVTSSICYPGDHPQYLGSTAGLSAWLLLFNAFALVGCSAGAFVSWRMWRGDGIAEGYGRFLALWALMSSIWFSAAILFNVLASVMVPACRG